MIRPGAIVMTVLMIAVAVGVYVGLDRIPADLVRGLKSEDSGAAKTADGQPLVADAGSAVATSEVDRMAQGVQDPIAPSQITEEDLAEEPPPSAPEPEPPMAGDAPSLSGAVDADPPVEGTAVAVEEPVAEEPVAEEPPAAPAEPAPAAAAPVAPPEPKPAQVAKASAASTADKPREPVKPEPPPADVIKPWWPDPATMPPHQLKLQYAGQVENERAIALLFSAPLNLATLQEHAEVQNANGGKVTSGRWELTKNPRMAVLRGVQPGRYTVILEPAVADANGYLLGTPLQGPVYIVAQ